jgi:hypothetical protein
MSVVPANIVMENTIERIYVKDKYGDVPLGLFLIRGENVVLLGDIVSFALISEEKENIYHRKYSLILVKRKCSLHQLTGVHL